MKRRGFLQLIAAAVLAPFIPKAAAPVGAKGEWVGIWHASNIKNGTALNVSVDAAGGYLIPGEFLPIEKLLRKGRIVGKPVAFHSGEQVSLEEVCRLRGVPFEPADIAPRPKQNLVTLKQLLTNASKTGKQALEISPPAA